VLKKLQGLHDIDSDGSLPKEISLPTAVMLRKNAPKHRKDEALQYKKHNKYLDTVRCGQ
jgi:hypothetical protein